MYCSHCGAAATGNFCSECGTAIARSAALVVNWEQELRYSELMRIIEVRALIDEHARMSRRGITGEQFLELCEKIAPHGVPLQLVASLIQPLYASWGIGTGKQRVVPIAAPVGRVMVRVLCSLAKQGQSLRHVKQASDGCLFEAALPSDLWSFEGDLLIAVRPNGSHTEVQAATKIKGQLFDWGKSNRCLDRLLADLQVDPTPASLDRLPRVA